MFSNSSDNIESSCYAENVAYTSKFKHLPGNQFNAMPLKIQGYPFYLQIQLTRCSIKRAVTKMEL